MEFLTEEKIDTGYLISVLKKDVDKHEGENARILQGLLFEFKKNNFAFLTPQETYFLNNNSQDVWADYLIFRYKFKIYPKQKII